MSSDPETYGLGIRWYNPKAIARQLEVFSWMNVECVIRRDPRGKHIQFVITNQRQTDRCHISTFENADWGVISGGGTRAAPLNLVPRRSQASTIMPASLVVAAKEIPTHPNQKWLEEWSIHVPFSPLLDMFKRSGDRHLLWQSIDTKESVLTGYLCNANGSGLSESQHATHVTLSFTNLSIPFIDGNVLKEKDTGGKDKEQKKAKERERGVTGQHVSLNIRNPSLLQNMISRLTLMDPYFQTSCVQTSPSTLESSSRRKSARPRDTKKDDHRHRSRHFLVLQTSTGMAQGRYIVPVGSSSSQHKTVSRANKTKSRPPRTSSPSSSSSSSVSASASSSASAAAEWATIQHGKPKLDAKLSSSKTAKKNNKDQNITAAATDIVPMMEAMNLRSSQMYELLRPVRHVWLSPDTWERHLFSWDDIRTTILPSLGSQNLIQLLLAENSAPPMANTKINSAGEMEFGGKSSLSEMVMQCYEKKFPEWKSRSSVTLTSWHRTDALCKKHQPNLPVHHLQGTDFDHLVKTLQTRSIGKQATDTKWPSGIDVQKLTTRGKYEIYSNILEWNSIMIVPRDLNATRTIMLVQRILPLTHETISEGSGQAGLVQGPQNKWYLLSDEAFFFVSHASTSIVHPDTPPNVTNKKPRTQKKSNSPIRDKKNENGVAEVEE